MKNIQLYEHFCLSESSKSFFRNKGLPEKYKDRAKLYGVSANPGILGKVSNFFNKAENRINNMANAGKGLQQSRRGERIAGGQGFNTGIEALFGIASVVPNVLKRVFGPSDYELGKSISSDDQVDIEFIRHTNDNFIKKDLPKIRSERQLEDNIYDLYRKAGVSRGKSPALDDIADNRANLYYTRETSPNQPIFQN